MRQITFLDSTSSNYLFGRGKDKKKRKSRTLLTAAKDFVVGGKNFIKEANIKSSKDLFNARKDIYNRKRGGSSVATNSTAVLGAFLGASQAGKLGINPALSAATGAFNLSVIGSAADRGISKEKARYRKEGARSRLGKVINDAKIGAKSTAGFLAVDEAIKQTRRSLAKPGNLPLKTKILGAIGSGVGGTIYGGAKGALLGGTIGSGVGTIRGFKQKNKTKDKK